MVLEDSEGLLQEDVYEFNIKNTGSIAARYDLSIINEVPSSYEGEVIPLEYIKVGLEINGEEYGPFNIGELEGIIDSNIIYRKEIINYKLRVWLDKEYEEDIETIEGYKAFLKLKVDAEQRVGDISGESKEFSYTGDYEEYIVPKDGWYYIELGGAQGGGENGGLGAVTSGYIELEAGEKLYFYVGEKGNMGVDAEEAYNGGGKGGSTNGTSISTTGGGATDVRLVGGSWDNTTSLISRIMVAGAGGGSHDDASYVVIGGAGGTLYGENGNSRVENSGTNGKGGRQIIGGTAGYIQEGSGWEGSTDGTFGKGGSGTTRYGGGGGGGYYGGGGAGVSSLNGSSGGGGSSYISGYAGVNSVEESTTITHTNQTLHYSGKYFIGGSMTSNANRGDGYAKIVYIDTKPKKKNTNLDNVRYIKNCISYNTYHNYNHWIEVQAIVDGVNIAKDKDIIGTVSENSVFPYIRITDGDITHINYAAAATASSANQCITIDLGAEYDLDEVAVWNYFGDQRSYYDNVTSVSSNNSTWREVIDEVSVETSNGHRVNAYTDTYNGYVQDSLVLWYDGYANTGEAKNSTATTWRDLSGNNNDGTLTGGTWNYNYLSFDGVDDTVDTNIDAAEALPSDSDRTLSITLKINSIPYEEDSNGYTGIFFGAGRIGGMGIHWIRNVAANSYSINGFTRATSISQVSILHQTYPTSILQLTYVNDASNGLVRFYLNGEKVGQSQSTTGVYPYEIGNIGINKAQIAGGPESANYANIDVYSAKIYNKALTEEEVLHNYLYDKQTFNIE